MHLDRSLSRPLFNGLFMSHDLRMVTLRIKVDVNFSCKVMGCIYYMILTLNGVNKKLEERDKLLPILLGRGNTDGALPHG